MLSDDIKKIIQGEVSDSPDDLASHSRDASIFQVQPSVIVYPQNAADIGALVRWVGEQKKAGRELSLTARSGGTDMTGGPLTSSIVLDMLRHFNHLGAIKDGLATTQPGVYYRDFEKATLATGWLLPSYPASREICTIGGMVNNNSGGEKSLTYGKTERYVKELSVVLSDGNEYTIAPLTLAGLEEKKSLQTFEGQLYRSVFDLIEKNYNTIEQAKPDVSKNSAGYYLWNVWDRKKFDLTQLIVGAQGTLGIVTQATFQLIQPKKYSQLLVMFLKDIKPLGEVVNVVLKHKPESFESFDDHTFKIAMRFLPQLVKTLGGNMVSLFLKFLPEMGMVLAGGIPKLILIAEFTADDQAAARAAARAASTAIETQFQIKTHLTANEKEAEKYWVIRRESFNLLRHHAGRQHTAPFIDDVIVHPSQLAIFLPELDALVAQYKALTYTIAGHAGDANFHIIPLMDFTKAENREIIPELSEKVYALIARMHGSITAEHNDGLVRTPYLPTMYPPQIIELFKQIKQIFDPLDIFNPGKKVPVGNDGPGTKEFSMSHMIHD